MSINSLNHKSKFIALISITGIMIFSCTKEEIPFVQYENTNSDLLMGDTAILVGTWSWIYTDHYFGWCDGGNYYESLTPTTQNCQFKINFSKAGSLSYYKNDSLKSQYRITFQYFDFNSLNACGSNFKQFVIDLDGFEDLNFGGCVSHDTLKCGAAGFLFYPEEGCESYTNYFVKE